MDTKNVVQNEEIGLDTILDPRIYSEGINHLLRSGKGVICVFDKTVDPTKQEDTEEATLSEKIERRRLVKIVDENTFLIYIARSDGKVVHTLPMKHTTEKSDKKEDLFDFSICEFCSNLITTDLEIPDSKKEEKE